MASTSLEVRNGPRENTYGDLVGGEVPVFVELRTKVGARRSSFMSYRRRIDKLGCATNPLGDPWDGA
jgi:hypothetical protein